MLTRRQKLALEKMSAEKRALIAAMLERDPTDRVALGELDHHAPAALAAPLIDAPDILLPSRHRRPRPARRPVRNKPLGQRRQGGGP